MNLQNTQIYTLPVKIVGPLTKIELKTCLSLKAAISVKNEVRNIFISFRDMTLFFERCSKDF